MIRTPRAHAPESWRSATPCPDQGGKPGPGRLAPRRRSPGAAAGRGSDGHLAPTRQGRGAGRGDGPLDRGAPSHASSARTRNRSKPACSPTSSKIRPRSRGERCSRRAFVLIVRYGVQPFCGPQALAAQSLIWSRVILALSRLAPRRRWGAGDIGIAMGGRGTDVAREASGLVLLDDDFSSIVQAVRLGRRVFDNLKKAMAYIIAIHVPIAGLSLVPVLLDWPLVLLPMHLVFLELIIDPACSVAFEAEGDERDVMTRPPRDPAAPLFGSRTVEVSVLQGLSVLIVLAVFAVALYRGQGELDARALTFTTLIVANLGLILANRSWSRTLLENLRTPNAAMWWVFGGATAFLFTVLYVPFLRDLFHFSTLHPNDLSLCLATGVVSLLLVRSVEIDAASAGANGAAGLAGERGHAGHCREAPRNRPYSADFAPRRRSARTRPGQVNETP
jgi:Cation transporting ATPase, C-terminus